MTKMLALLLSLALPGVAFANGGDMDTTVSPTGILPVLSTLNDTAFVFARQPDGKFIVVHNDPSSVTIQRRLATGVLDTTFGIGGSATYPRAVPLGSPIPAVPVFVKAVGIAADGKIVLAGEAHAACGTIGLARLKGDGYSDAGFGTNGWSALLPSDSTVGHCNPGATFTWGALKLYPSGAIMAVAYPYEIVSGRATGTAFVGRWRSNGMPDERFGTGGFVRPVFQWLDDQGNANIADDGSVELVHAQQTATPSPWTLISTRLSVDGLSRTDTALPVPEDMRVAPGVAFSADGSRLVHSRSSGTAGEVSIARVKANDSADAAYGTAGRARITLAPQQRVDGLLPSPDGGALLVTSALEPPNDEIAMTKVDALGRLEPSFGKDGRFGFSTSPLSEFPWQLAMQPDGYLEVFGYTQARVAADIGYTWYFARLQAVPDVVEFENTALDHYFLTYDNAEARGIDAGAAGAGWRRTNLSFRPGGSTLVCRFYGTPGKGPNSHFYTAEPSECEQVKKDPGWTYEGVGFSVTRKDDGLCPPNLRAIWRLYNNRYAQNDSNHRFLADPGLIGSMVARGWIDESIAFCARP